MQNYELLLIISDKIKETELPAALSNVKKVFDKYSAKISEENIWGLMKLAYPIKKRDQGYYILWGLSMEPSQVVKLSDELKIVENVLRFLLTEKPKHGQTIESPAKVKEREEKEAIEKKPEVKTMKEAPKTAEKEPLSESDKKSLDQILDEKI